MDTSRRPAAAPGRDRLPSLTGLRFWAALVVVLYHLSRQSGRLPGVSDLVWYGRSGVTFFFVLSGFVLAWSYDGKRVPAKVFLWRRFARIWPMLAVSVAASVAAYLAIGTEVSRKGVVAALLVVNAWIPDKQFMMGGNPAAWSLSDEAFFYALFPLLLVVPFLRTARRRLWTAVVVCAASAALWLGGALISDLLVRRWFLDYFPPVRMLQFVLGVAAGLAVKRGWRPPVGLPAAVALVLAWQVALVPWSRAVPDSAWYSAYSASQLLSAPLFAALVAAAAYSDVRRRTTGLAGPWMIRLGNWSFAWYLIHEIVLRVLLVAVGHPRTQTATAAFWALVLAVSLALAGLAYHWVEHPLERVLRRAGPRTPGTGPARPEPAASV
ncbi:acyltransferase family protein [Streptomyces sp. NPDC090994]|uniref:acyltransferase family protein n=1 Tax=Streptomyces sp. NPDC090994 TaxID=3365969 RepID=UPI0038177381